VCSLAYLSAGCVVGVVTEVKYRPIATPPPAVRAAVNLEVARVALRRGAGGRSAEHDRAWSSLRLWADALAVSAAS
jgi:hypothetical protein